MMEEDIEETAKVNDSTDKAEKINAFLLKYPNYTAKRDRIQKEADKDMELPDNLADAVDRRETIITDIQKWCRTASQQYIVYNDLLIAQAELRAKLLVKYKKNGLHIGNDDTFLATTKEIDTAIEADKDYCKIARRINEEKAIYDLINETKKNLTNLQFTIKDYIEYKYMMMGKV